MSVGYMRVSFDGDRQTTGLQREAHLAEGVDDRRFYKDDASGARAARPGPAFRAALNWALRSPRSAELLGLLI